MAEHPRHVVPPIQTVITWTYWRNVWRARAPGLTLDEWKSQITHVQLPDTATEIGWNAFEGFASLIEIDVPNGVTRLGQRAFSCCFSLVTVRLGSQVLEIGTDAFRSCGNLQTIIIPNSVWTIQFAAFRHCVRLRRVTLGSRVHTISERAFEGCVSLKSLLIPDNVRHIEASAFEGCVALRAVVMPARMEQIAPRCFFGCDHLHLFLKPTLYDFARYGEEPVGWQAHIQNAMDGVNAWLPPTVRIWAADEVVELLQGPFKDISRRTAIPANHQALPLRASWPSVESALYTGALETMPFALAVQQLHQSSQLKFPIMPPDLIRRINFWLGGTDFMPEWADPTLHPPAAPQLGDVHGMLLHIGLTPLTARLLAIALVKHGFPTSESLQLTLVEQDFGPQEDFGEMIANISTFNIGQFDHATIAGRIERYLGQLFP
jgi:hypothetical protein